jgi:hypothetical protein
MTDRQSDSPILKLLVDLNEVSFLERQRRLVEDVGVSVKVCLYNDELGSLGWLVPGHD